MPKIQVLDKHVAELIAAGEVVERPSSVVKELVENAVDAGASVITVEIRNGGVTYIRITDNGCGISSQDVPTAFLRHATSKITKEQDLDAIMTLGFRGEALASISAVSRIELLTRPQEDAVGTRYTSAGSDTYEIEETGCPAGTTLIIRDLFFNTPVRMKFLKKDVTEGNAVAGILDKIALSHPEISFRFIRDGKELLHTPGDNKLSSAIYAVYGKAFSETLLPVDYSLNHIRVTGFISAPAGSRANRSMQNFFINGRFIKSRTAGAALDEAFKGSVMVGKFAACVLNLEMSFATVDVNVHPAKLEVRFVNERPIFDVVYHGVKSALENGDSPKIMTFHKPPVLPYAPAERAEQLQIQASAPGTVNADTHKQSGDTTANPIAVPVLTGSENPVDAARAPSTFASDMDKTPFLRDSVAAAANPKSHNSSFPSFLRSVIDIEVEPEEVLPLAGRTAPAIPVQKPEVHLQVPAAEEPVKEKNTQSVVQESSLPQHSASQDVASRLIGEAFDTYVIMQYGKDELLLIDKHAAHERLLYEKLKTEHGDSAAQTLLEPVLVTLEKDQCVTLLDNSKMLLQAGFDIGDFGAGTILVRTAPLLLDGGDVTAAIEEIAGYLSTYKTDITTEHMDWVFHNVACRAAIKGGDHSSREELIALAKKLEENPDVRYCPHGRPISIKIKKRDLEKQFGRV